MKQWGWLNGSFVTLDVAEDAASAGGPDAQRRRGLHTCEILGGRSYKGLVIETQRDAAVID